MIVILALALVLTVVGYLVLPETLVMQITLSGEGGTTLPKIIGLLVPLALSGIFSVLYYKNENSSRSLIVALVGLAMYAFVFAVNL